MGKCAAKRTTSTIASVDVSKFILSIMVVAIHVSPFTATVRALVLPLLRIAVPLFFLFSSYFLFKKIFAQAEREQKLQSLRRYIMRTALLYFFWYVVLFVPTFMYRQDTYQAWFSNGMFEGVLHYITSIIFSSTFKASWYLSASIIGAIVAYLTSNHKNISILLASLCFLLSCASSNYYGALPDSVLFTIKMLGKLGSPYNSFPVAIFWMILGRELARFLTDNIASVLTRNTGALILCTLMGLLTLYLERSAIVFANISRADDCYISLPFVVTPLFLFIISRKELRFPTAVSSSLRMSSTVTYCAHATLGFMLPRLFPSLDGANLFIFVVLLCWLICAIIYVFEKRLGLVFLKYTH